MKIRLRNGVPRTSVLFAILAFRSFIAAPVSAQVTATGALEGRVVDSSKAVVANAVVKLANDASGLRREAKSNEEGLFRFELLPAGQYTVSAEMAGFAKVTYQAVGVAVGNTTTVNVTLEPGKQTEVVTVEGSAAPLVDVQKTDVSFTITPAQVQDLPLNGRDFANLAFLAPGAKPVNSYDPTKNRIGVFGVNGSAGRNVNITVNGIDNKDNTVGGPVMQLPLEAVQEFSISTQRFSAANGRSEGAAVNVITRGGTNQLHGSLYLFERDTALTANDYFSKLSGQDTPPISRQQYGGSFGAPIKKDRTFVFFTLEREREETSIGVTSQAFTELSLVTALGAQPAHVIPTPYRDQRYSGRLDHRINDHNNLVLAYNSQGNRGLDDQSGQTNDLTAGNFTTNQLILANATLNSILSPAVVNSFTFGHQYWNNLIDSDKKVPNISFPNSIYFGTNGNVPQQSFQRKWQFRDDLSWTRGKHSFKVGFDLVHEPSLGGFFQTPPTLNIGFLDLPSVITTNKTKYPQGFATPGAVTSMSASSGNPYFHDKGAKMLGFYFQDDMRLTRKLAVNLGVRWDADYHLNGDNVQGQSRTYLALKAINSVWASKLPKTDLNNVSPRVGLAYDITGTGRHVVRAGWGIYYGQTFQNIPLFMEQQANDTVFTQTLSISSGGPGDPTASVVPGTGGILLSAWRFGVDPLPAVPAGSPNLTAGAVGRLVDPNFANPYNHQFNGGYSFQIDNNNVIEAEYVHVLGLREAKRQNINYQQPEFGGARPFDAAFTAAGLPKLAQIVVESSIGRSRYDGFNLSYRRRLNRRFSINTNYVLSRSLAYVGGPAAFGNAAPIPTNLFPSYDLGPAPNDEKHRWVFSGILQLPGGIQVAPIMQLASARPYSATQGLTWTSAGSGNGTTRAVILNTDPNNLRATKDLTAQQIRDGIAAGTMHEIGYDTLRGQPFFQFDLRASKVFTFGERHKLEFISQFFNLTNRANFGGNYVTSIRSDTFGTPNGYIAPSAVIVPKSFAAELAVQYRF
ncbi:MAG: hypothetical protein C5B56_02255 [Proteobacteria bacterium]|nr:MAG: hypothetical protein C5B56_02255 [Pseudomonadota bacterium]